MKKDFELVGKIRSSRNILVEGENLKIMTLLESKLTNAIDLIYIDPPYNTGKKMGKYNDNFGSHEEWAEFIKPRLLLAKKFLTDNGMIFISIGENEEAYLKILCDQIFGEKNRVSSIIWQCKYTIANDKSGISNQVEYILVYAKDIKKININNDPLRDEYINKTYKNPDNDPRGLWRGGVQLFKNKNKKSYTVESPNGIKWTKPWNYSESQWYNVLEKEGLIYWGKDGNSCPVKKVFLKNTKGVGIGNLWLGSEVGYTADGGLLLNKMGFEKNSFLYSKPVSLIKRILQIATTKNSTILDFFAGSGTTGHATLELNKEDGGNRQFILINNKENELCSKLIYPRLERVIFGYVDNDNVKIDGTDGELAYFKLNDKQTKERISGRNN